MSISFFDDTSKLAIATYLQWLVDLGLIDLLRSHLFPEKLIFERKWAESAVPLFMDILSFLTEKDILKNEGGTISLTVKGEKFLQTKDKVEISPANPVFHYLRIGLEKLKKLLNHDENIFILDRDCFLLENAFTYPYRLELLPLLKKIYREELKLDRPPKVALVGNFVEWFLPSIVDLIETPDQVHLIVPSELAVERGISFAELDERTAIFSPNFKTYNSKFNDQYDLIFHFFAFGFDINPSDLNDLLMNHLAEKGILVGVFPIGLARCGIEPLFPLIDTWQGNFSPEKIIMDLEKVKDEKFLRILKKR
ncbi:MAG: hypothetical protein D6732_14665 [Methanobacteriota archaeon]|nr:MAG: hypothetical protein D6732_14665 [Euryarchaeota archaeon]